MPIAIPCRKISQIRLELNFYVIVIVELVRVLLRYILTSNKVVAITPTAVSTIITMITAAAMVVLVIFGNGVVILLTDNGVVVMAV